MDVFFESRLKVYEKEPWYHFYKVLLQPPSTFDYLLVLLTPLANEQLIEAVGVQIDIELRREGSHNLTEVIRGDSFALPMVSEEIREKTTSKYDSMLEKLVNQVQDNIERFVNVYTKAIEGKITDSEMAILKSYVGDALWSEFSWFLKNQDNLNARRKAELIKKFVSIIFQRSTEAIMQVLWKRGVVLRDRNLPPTTLRLVWIPQGDSITSTGIYDVPESKAQLLSLLRAIMPGLIDFSTSVDENELIRIARLTLKLDDEYDIDTIMNLIGKLYLEPNEMRALLEELKGHGLPKKLTVYAMLSYILTKKNGHPSFIIFEGSTPVTIIYPAIKFEQATNKEKSSKEG